MIQFDAVSVAERIKDKLRAKSSWQDILFFSTNQRIIDAVAEEIADDMQYDEKLTTECKWNLAKQTTSILAENKFFNYFPYRKNGASGVLKVSTSPTYNTSYSLPIAINKYDVFASDTLNFCALINQTLLASDMYKNIEIVQGTPKEETFTALGNSFETFTVNNSSIENNYYDVYVNNEIYTKVDSIREADSATSKVYVLENLNDFSGVTIQFGDDYFGRKLVLGDTVVFKYIETAGDQGNVGSAGIIVNTVSTFYDSTGKAVQLYCTNDSAINGGTTYEDIENIREKAPKKYKSGDTAITSDDYKSIIEAFPFVKKVNVWGEEEVNEDAGNEPGTFIAAEENVVHVAIVSNLDSSITAYQESLIREGINNKKGPTDIIQFDETNFIYIAFNIAAFITDKNYTISYVTEQIATQLSTKYSISALSFKHPIYLSDYIATINNADGVGYHNTTFQLYTFDSFTSSYVCNIDIAMTNIKPNSVKLYIKDVTQTGLYVLFAQDDGAGNLVANGTLTLSGSTINYTNGIATVIITDGLTAAYPNYSIKTVFSVTDSSILPTARNQIISLGDGTTTVTYA